MVFQLMDDKKDCVGVYTNGQFIYDRIPTNLDSTWAYSEHLRDLRYQISALTTCLQDGQQQTKK